MLNLKISENGRGANGDGTGKRGKSGLLADIGKRVTTGFGIVAVASAMALGCAGCDAAS